MSDTEFLDPGLQGYSDSGSDFHDLPEPELPKGVRKTCVDTAGQGPTLKRPNPGDEVSIRCSGTWLETKEGFSLPASLEDGAGLARFTLGKGQVMHGLDLAVTTMRLGEVAKFELSRDFAVETGSALTHGSGVTLSRPILELKICLVDWMPREDLFQDGTAVKSVLQRPDDLRRPIIGQVCLLSLVLRADGGDELWQRSHFEHTIEDIAPGGTVDRRNSWRLLDKALLSMKRGEHASLRCSCELLLTGAPAELLLLRSRLISGLWVLELKLKEFIEISDISFEKDSSVRKRSLHCRDAWVPCQDAGECKLKVLSVEDASGNFVAKDISLAMKLGSGDVCDALECAVASMRQGEVAEITCRCKESCSEPQLGLQGLEMATFRLEVASYTPGSWEASRGDQAKLQALSGRKTKGVELYRAGRYRLAAYHFSKVYELLGYVDDFRGVRGAEDQKTQIADLKRASLLNRALCLLRLGSFKAAVDSCDLLLDVEPSNTKALFRRAQAHLGLEDYMQALRDSKAVLALEPGSADARRLCVQVKEKQKVLDASSKMFYSKMCDGLGHLPHPLDVD